MNSEFQLSKNEFWELLLILTLNWILILKLSLICYVEFYVELENINIKRILILVENSIRKLNLILFLL